jgi:hypothetical protein
MPLNEKEQIPNKPLTGSELADYIVFRLRERVTNDHHFGAQISYRRVAFEITIRLHTDRPTGAWEVHTFTRPEGAVIEGQPPLIEAPGDSEVLALDVAVDVENPNLARVAAGLPVQIVTRQPAKPGEIFPKVEHHEVRYDPTDYPPPTPPVVTDKSEQVAEEWGVKPRRRSPSTPKGRQ